MQIRGRRQTSGWPRVNCLVDGCRRGTTRIEPLPADTYWISHEGQDPEWVCGLHWRRVPRWMRRRLRRLENAHRRWHQINRETSTKVSFLKTLQSRRLAIAMWKRMKDVAAGGRVDLDVLAREFGI